jgi:hypothetical protein
MLTAIPVAILTAIRVAFLMVIHPVVLTAMLSQLCHVAVVLPLSGQGARCDVPSVEAPAL